MTELIKDEWNKRIKILKKEIKKAIKGKSKNQDEMLTIIKLF